MSESTQVTVTDLNDGYAQQIEARTHQFAAVASPLAMARWQWPACTGT